MTRRTLSGLFALFALGALFAGGPARAESEAARRVKAGVRVFRTILAADSDIAGKLGPDGSLLLLLIGDSASGLEGSLKETISGHKTSVKAISPDELSAYASQAVAGVFLADPTGEDALRQAIRFGIDRKIVTYSPFEGDVEKGILGGLSIEATVRPFINMSTLRSSGMRIKPFFLRVAKLHE